MHDYAALFLPWDVPEIVNIGDIRRYKGQLYKCIISHTTQLDWAPDVATTIWNKVAEPGAIPEWSSFASHEFQNMAIGTAVMDLGTVYYLINPGHGFRRPSASDGHFGWSTTKP